MAPDGTVWSWPSGNTLYFWRTLIRVDYATNNLTVVRERAAALARQLNALGWGITMDEETAELLDEILGPWAVRA